jgi:predicted CXXCH cytochrome family protein
VTHFSATLGGTVSSDGAVAVTDRGTVWGTSPNPTGNAVSQGSGNGLFTHGRTGFPAGTLIYFRAYAANAGGTSYSGDGSFMSGTEPTVQATNVLFSKTSARGMRIRWTRGNGEGSIVVVRPTIGTSRADPVDGTSYAANHLFPEAEEIPTANYVVYAGVNSYVDVGLMDPPGTAYSVAVYEYTSSSGTWNYLQASPALGSNPTTNEPVHNTDVGAECGQCHSGHNDEFLPHDTAQQALCETCHNETGDAKAKLNFALHVTPTRNPDLTYVDCGFCHELHNPSDGNTTFAYNSITLNSDYNKSYLRANVDKYVSTATTDGAFLHNDTYDAGDPLNADTPERAVEGGSDTTARGYCQVCHSYTKYHRGQEVLTVDRPNVGDPAANQCHDGEGREGGPGACISGAPETQCGSCHEHTAGFQGVGGSQTCHECHSSPQGSMPRATITTQFDRPSRHYPGATDPADCEVCHAQLGAGAIVRNKHPDTNDGQVTLWNVDDHNADAYQLSQRANSLSLSENYKMENFCLNCHDADGAKYVADQGGNGLQPFTGSQVDRPLIDSNLWATSAHDDSPLVSCMGDGDTGCHGSGHGSEKDFLLAPADTASDPITNAEEKQGLCFNCHDGGIASSDIKSIFPDRPAYDAGYRVESMSGALVNQRHDILYDDQQYSGMVVTCIDCDDPHADNADNPVSDPDDGSTLAPYSTANSYNEDNYNFAYDSGGPDLDPVNPEGSINGPYSEPDYIQFCLTCHDGTVPAGVVLLQNPPDGRNNMINIADAYANDDVHGAQAASFGSSLNKGGMWQPWVTAADETAGLDPSAPYAAMNCNTCHDAHGSENIYNLRSSINVGGMDLEVGGNGNLNEPHYNGSTTYILPEIDGAQKDHYWGAWCTFCHKIDSGHASKIETDSCQNGHMHGNGAF